VSTLGEATWPEAGARAARLLLVPLGSCEQHGPHLPLDTDTRIAVAVAKRAADQLDAWVAPALAYGASGEHGAFPGTLSMGTAALEHAVVELVRSADAFGGVVLVNGHGGNAEAVDGAVRKLLGEGRRVAAWWPGVEHGDAHAGRTETSVLLRACPEVVRVDLAESGDTRPLEELMPTLRAGGVAAVSPNGVLGAPAGASAAEGEELLVALTADLVLTAERLRSR